MTNLEYLTVCSLIRNRIASRLVASRMMRWIGLMFFILVLIIFFLDDNHTEKEVIAVVVAELFLIITIILSAIMAAGLDSIKYEMLKDAENAFEKGENLDQLMSKDGSLFKRLAGLEGGRASGRPSW